MMITAKNLIAEVAAATPRLTIVPALAQAAPSIIPPSQIALSTLARIRQYLFLDWDNMSRTANPSSALARHTLAAFLAEAGYQPGDQVVIACSTNAARTTFFECNIGARLLAADGKDGADLVLIEAMADLAARGTATRVVLGSGDHIFTDVVGTLQRAGAQVHVVAPRGTMANRLRMAGDTHAYIDLPLELMRGA